GVVLRGRFRESSPLTPDPSPRASGEEVEWCDRRLLARIHRYTLNRLRAEIEPLSAADFTRFLFAWQHATVSTRLTGAEGLRAVIGQLDGYEIAAGAWERAVLPLRLDRYDGSALDTLCLNGDVAWGRLTAASEASRIVGATPVALFLREHSSFWLALRSGGARDVPLSGDAQRIVETLQNRGALFVREIVAAAELSMEEVGVALAELVAAGLISSDGFAGLRSLIAASAGRPRAARAQASGRWSRLRAEEGDPVDREEAVERQARVLLSRYGVVFRRLVARETGTAPWRELARLFRRLELRGEIRGGRFVGGMSGEQFALPEAVERMREIRRTMPDGEVIIISAADPLNLTGILTSGERVRAIAGSRIAYVDGVAVSVMEGDTLHPLADLDPARATDVASALAGRPVPVTRGYVGRVSRV
ncbi:MAG TPA: ATP-dependent DNA helicase, partial [Thermoanaerobaculia bacterium]|nr:ATP-dependent DNA helicase [Thermoanaerobaculia bacterium]